MILQHRAALVRAGAPLQQVLEEYHRDITELQAR